jgi:hypothetical protein
VPAEVANGAGRRRLHAAAGARRWSAAPRRGDAGQEDRGGARHCSGAPAAGLDGGSSAALGDAGGAPASVLGAAPSRRSAQLDGGSRTEELAWRT